MIGRNSGRLIDRLSANGQTPMKEGLTLAMKEILENGMLQFLP